MLWASSTTRVCTAAETLQVVLGGERAGSGSLAVWFWHRNCAVSLRVSDGQLHQTRRALRCLLWRLCALLGLCVRRAAQQRQAAGGAVPVQTPGALMSARDLRRLSSTQAALTALCHGAPLVWAIWRCCPPQRRPRSWRWRRMQCLSLLALQRCLVLHAACRQVARTWQLLTTVRMPHAGFVQRRACLTSRGIAVCDSPDQERAGGKTGS